MTITTWKSEVARRELLGLLLFYFSFHVLPRRHNIWAPCAPFYLHGSGDKTPCVAYLTVCNLLDCMTVCHWGKWGEMLFTFT